MSGGRAVRGVRETIAVAVVFLLTACGKSPTAGGDPPPPAPLPQLALAGADISALTRIEEAGGHFRDNGQPADAIAALKAHGSNIFRLRLFLNPNHDEVQVNDLPYTLALAQRIKAAGGRLLLDFHYSDTWADPGHQVTPVAWQALDINALEQQVETYTADVLNQFKAAGVIPAIVQVGNEVDGGMLWPLGRIGTTGYDAPANNARFGRLLKAGIRGVRTATTPADSVRVMIHFSQGASADKTTWFFDLLQAQDVTFDLIGLSYYPWWHGTLADFKHNLDVTAARYGKGIVVVETGYPWRSGWTPSGAIPGTMPWPATADGQSQFVQDVRAAIASTAGGRGLGLLWWYPEAIKVPALFIYGDGALALFDDAGNLLPAGSALGGR